MFISIKRHEREKQELRSVSNRLTEAVLEHSQPGLFLLDGKGRVLPQVSRSLATLLRREDFSNVTFEKLLAPLVTAKTLTEVRAAIAATLSAAADSRAEAVLQDVEVRLTNADGSIESAHYSFAFDAVDVPDETRGWLVRLTDITQRVQMISELEDLRAQAQIQGEMLRGILRMGGARFAAFLKRTDGSMQVINTVLKKPAREEDAFRNKLEEILEEVDRVRKDAAAFKFAALETSARTFEDALHELRSRRNLSGSDFLPLAVKLERFYSQFAELKSATAAASPAKETDTRQTGLVTTDGGTEIIEAPRFNPDVTVPINVRGAQQSAAAGSLERTLTALLDHVALEQGKTVALRCVGLQLVPPAYQAAVKNVAIQLIRNSVLHGIESKSVRKDAGKPAHGTLQLEFKSIAEKGFEFLFEDDGCGLDPDFVRATAVTRGVITADAADRLRDREAIKLIFKSGYSTLAPSPGTPAHGAGMSLVRRYVHEAGGKVALASLLGHETRFKITLPALPPD